MVTLTSYSKGQITVGFAPSSHILTNYYLPLSKALYAKIDMKLSYQILMFLTLLSVTIFSAFYLGYIPKMESGIGNGGSFLAALFLVFGVLGVLTTTILGTLAFAIAFVFDDKLPNTKAYHWGIPLFFCIPGYSVCLFILYNWLGIGI